MPRINVPARFSGLRPRGRAGDTFTCPDAVGAPVARRNEPRVPKLPEPPWTYSPAEVQEWIRGGFPSGKRTRKEVRKGSETVTRLRFTAVGADADGVRAALRKALGSIGVAMAEGPGAGEGPGRHRAVTALRGSLLGSRVRVTIDFEPPIHPSSRKRLVAALSRDLRVEGVEEKGERPRLRPPKEK